MGPSVIFRCQSVTAKPMLAHRQSLSSIVINWLLMCDHQSFSDAAGMSMLAHWRISSFPSLHRYASIYDVDPLQKIFFSHILHVYWYYCKLNLNCQLYLRITRLFMNTMQFKVNLPKSESQYIISKAYDKCASHCRQLSKPQSCMTLFCG